MTTSEVPAGSPADAPAARGTGWQEEYQGGSAEAEVEQFRELAGRMMKAQAVATKKAGAHGVPYPPARALHSKATFATDAAELRFDDDLAEDLRAGFAQPGATYQVLVRFSNASNVPAADGEADLRGVAMRVLVDDGTSHDLLATNFPVSHARNAEQFVEFALATAGDDAARVLGLARLAKRFGPAEVARMVKNVTTGRKHTPGSVFTETYWSRGALCWGGRIAVRYLLAPAPGTPTAAPSTTDPAYLSTEAVKRLAADSVVMELYVQRYRDPESTPIEDTSVEWTEQTAPRERVAVLTFPRGDVTSVHAQAASRAVDALAFNPWNTTDEFRPLGNLNRARKAAYDASAAVRGGSRWFSELPKRNEVVGAVSRRTLEAVNRRVEWHRLPYRVGVLNLDGYRHVLRDQNLLDTDPPEAPPKARPVPAAVPEEARWTRTFDGTYNDLGYPTMGSVGAPFGRNLKPDYRPDTFDDPNPVLVSDRLLKREHFIPATTLNILAAAWIQFQVHDWVNHARHPLGVADVAVPMPYGRRWANSAGGPLEKEMRIAGNVDLGTAADGTQRLFANAASHWWDASEVYGSDAQRAASLREGAKIRMTGEGYLPDDLSGQEITGFNESWWLGLSALHTLFAREHNVLVDELRARYPSWSDDRLFHTARLIVAALIAKIHTVEWTPAILFTRALDLGMKANWYGPPSNDWLTRLGIWLTDIHAGVGIPKTKPDHGKAPFSLTEDFVTVYRLHPLIPDDYLFQSHADNSSLATRTFNDIQGAQADDQLKAFGLENTLYSFGTAHPGAITLHNYPQALRDFTRDGEHIDLAVVDLVRVRRRGIPRYNDFRAGLHKPRLRDFEQVSSDPATVAALRELYRTVDDVDTMVGLHGEAPPEGFGFSDTAFRIFILMASRRIQSDRFLTVDFRPEVYSPLGMDWIANNSMTSVILRHCPELAPLLPRDLSAFAPWRVAAPAAGGPR